MKTGKLLLLIAFISFVIVGCKDVPQEIIGTWNFQTFDNQPQGTVTWTFKEGGALMRVYVKEDGIDVDTCNYVVDKSMFKTQVTISNSNGITGFSDVNGLYRIDKFKDDILIMTRIRLGDDSTDGSYLRCEMMRKN
ncbi:MAG: hypothetical protein PHW82_08545 [Bacteroidales bacterium]|nr:hypothetical protein [Bacteroidales bacterium]